MELYDEVSYQASRMLTLRYSTSFGISSRFFARSIRHHIYAIYGLVRIADEIVDTYSGPDASTLLDQLQRQVEAGLKSGYSTNPVVHAFCKTAKHYRITKTLIDPFFVSMRVDTSSSQFTESQYKRYIYGSAEVIGLMCLRIFCEGDTKQYAKLKDGATALGSAYQKVNFLRDMASDYKKLGRVYFPNVLFNTFSEFEKDAIITDIKNDFSASRSALNQLPKASRTAVRISYVYYTALLKKLEKSSSRTITTSRIRISGFEKLWLLIAAVLGYKGQV